MERYKLVVNDLNGEHEYDLHDAKYSLGRMECDILLDSPVGHVSQYHATLIQSEDGGYKISDGDEGGNLSRNGLFVNGQKVQS